MVAAIFFLLGRGGPLKLVAIAWIPVLFFWGLDGYFLWQERLFRALYDHVRVQEEGEIDFSMDISSFRAGRARTWLGATFSRTLSCFYGALVLAISLTIIVS